MDQSKKSARFNVKAFTSLILMATFLVIAISGVVLYIGPHGRVAHTTNWTLLGLNKGQWNHLHMTGALLFLIAAVFHLVWNWGMFWGYIKKKGKAGLNLKIELALALILGIVVVAGTIVDIVPFSSFFELKRTINSHWAPPSDGEVGPGRGQGRGQGQGPGYGQGRGQGQGRGLGPGRGKGQGLGHGQGQGQGRGRQYRSGHQDGTEQQ